MSAPDAPHGPPQQPPARPPRRGLVIALVAGGAALLLVGVVVLGVVGVLVLRAVRGGDSGAGGTGVASAAGPGASGAPSSTPGSTPGSTLGGALAPAEVFRRNVTATVQVAGATERGTGVVLDAAQGLVVTNAHVARSSGSLSVVTSSGESVPARRVGVSPCDDLAVLQMTSVPSGVTQVVVGDSTALQAQDQVSAIGFPASFDAGSVRKPVSSSGAVQVPRLDAAPGDDLPVYVDAIQHDATINPGNSGGPLFDDRGELVGINSLTNPSSGGRPIQDQFYAISTEHLLPVVAALEAGTTSSDVGLHGTAFADLSADDVQAEWPTTDAASLSGFLAGRGVSPFVVLDVESGSTGAQADLAPGDIVATLDGQAVSTFADVCSVLQSRSPGDSVEVTGYWGEASTTHTAGQPWTTQLQVGRTPTATGG